MRATPGSRFSVPLGRGWDRWLSGDEAGAVSAWADGARGGDAFCMDKMAWAHESGVLDGGRGVAAFWRRRTFGRGVYGWREAVGGVRRPLRARWMHSQDGVGMWRWFADEWYDVDEESDPEVVVFDVGEENKVKALRDGRYEFEMPKVGAGPHDRVFGTMEACDADMGGCEWAFSHGFDDEVRDPRHMRMPCASSAVHQRPRDFFGRPDFSPLAELRRKTSFCSFVYGHDTDRRREVFELLSAYRGVDAFGPTGLNNMGGRLVPKGTSDMLAMKPRAFLRRYKFTVAFENDSKPGYVTEKLAEPLAARSVPIYWGDPRAAEEFNPLAFVNCHDFDDVGAAVDRVVELDRDDDAYMAMLAQPPFRPGEMPAWADPYALRRRLVEVFG